MLQNFSQTLVELYESAESVGIDAFPGEVVRAVKSFVEFDCLFFGIAEPSALKTNQFEIRSALAHGSNPAILLDHAKFSVLDSITPKFLVGLSGPLTSSVSIMEPGKCMDELRAFHTSHEMEHLLFSGQAGADLSPARLLVLCRSSGTAFDMQDSLNVEAIWPHLLRSLSINRSHFLRLHSHSRGKSVGLSGSGGYIETAEPLFRELCAIEWPLGSARKVPLDVLLRCKRGQDFIGARVKFKMKVQQNDFTVLQAVAISPVDRLTPTERIVANNFAAGQSAKVIANNLGRSVNTVRSQLTQVYDKLNIHDKGELASNLRADSAHFELADVQS